MDLLVSCIYFYVLIFADSLFLVLFASSLGPIVSFSIVALVVPDLAPFLAR